MKKKIIFTTANGVYYIQKAIEKYLKDEGFITEHGFIEKDGELIVEVIEYLDLEEQR